MVRNADKEISAISIKINTLTEKNNKNYEEINKIKNNNIETEREVGGFRFIAEAFGIELKNVVKFFIFLIVIVFDPLAVALIIAFNGMIEDKKRKQKEALVEMMRGDEELGLYEVYGDKKEDLVENIQQNTEDSGKILPIEEKTDGIVENNSHDDTHLSDLKWEEFMHPDFPWAKKNLWINNPKAVQYWISSKNGNMKELYRIRNEEENIKKY
jgi:hypothetical protein